MSREESELFEVVGPGSEKWDNAWNSMAEKQRDIYASRHYYEAHALLDPCSEPECAILTDDRGTLVYPYFRCPLSAYPWLNAPPDTFHLITAYGYGGIYGSNGVKSLLSDFMDSFASHCRTSGVVAELIRLNPLMAFPQCLKGYYDLKRASSQIVVALQRSDQDIWTSYRHNNRKNINKAVRTGIEVFHEGILGERFGDFLEIYAHTMGRREAKGYFHFPVAFYEHLSKTLGNRCKVFYAVLEDRTLSVELVLCSDTAVYSFLGGTREEYFESRPNNILKHEIIRWARDSGFDDYLLGGGPGGSDGIYEFKRSFAPAGVIDFEIASKVHDKITYEYLINICLTHPPQSFEAASAYPLRWMYSG